MKRSAESVAEEEANIQTLCDACKKQTLTEVVAAYQKVGTPNVLGKHSFDDRPGHRQTPLMFACMNSNYKEAKAIVLFLLAQGASVTAIDDDGDTVLHFAALHSSLEVVRLLVDEWRHPVDPRAKDGTTPLRNVVNRNNQQEAVKIARFLVSKGADLCATTTDGYMTSLASACRSNVSFKMVEALSPKNHPCINQVDDRGITPLMECAENSYHGTRSLTHLIVMGADPLVETSSGKNFLAVAYNYNAALLKCAALYASALQISNLAVYWLPGDDCSDVLGVFRAAQNIHGKKQSKKLFRFAVEQKQSTRHVWAILRAGPPCLDGTENDYFRVLREKGASHAIWREVAQIAASGMHPITGDTLLHNAVRTKDLSTVKYLLATQPMLCPFFRNMANETPIDLARKLHFHEAVQVLAAYSAWRPAVTDWYGPFFRMRARTFLLVCKRLRVFPKDVVLLILGWVAADEEV